MFFIHKIKHATNKEWGICEKCQLVPNTGMLCSGCLLRRNEYFHQQVEAVHTSVEWRLRSWLCNLLKPEIKFRD